MTTSINGTSGIVFPDGSTQNTVSLPGMRNRIINGAMMIDQRNAGAAVTLTAANLLYPVDRFFAYRASGTTGATAQQFASGITGVKNAVRIQRTAGNTATDNLIIGQVLESNNSYDLAGQSITLSFQARCGANFSASGSQIVAKIGTGTGTDQSAANFANNAWTGQVNSTTAITLTTSWQTFTVTVAVGASVTQVGMLFYWTPSGTAGAADYVDITGVQLEKGSTATSFDYRPYTTELQLCQRYLPVVGVGAMGTAAFTTTGAYCFIPFPVTPRVGPTGITVINIASISIASAAGSLSPSVIVFNSNTDVSGGFVTATVSGATAGQAGIVTGGATGKIQFTGCEL